MLKISSRKLVYVRDWDRLVIETYGKPYSLQQQNGCEMQGLLHIDIPRENYIEDFENDFIPETINGDEMGVSFKAWLARDPKDGHQIFWNRNFYPDIQMIANDLYNKGLIERGQYSINID